MAYSLQLSKSNLSLTVTKNISAMFTFISMIYIAVFCCDNHMPETRGNISIVIGLWQTKSKTLSIKEILAVLFKFIKSLM